MRIAPAIASTPTATRRSSCEARTQPPAPGDHGSRRWVGGRTGSRTEPPRTQNSPPADRAGLADTVTVKFEVLATDGAARRGRLTTAHGVVETPAFMPVGTRGTVKALGPDDLIAAGA